MSKPTPKPLPTPIRDGDWRMVNGQLVDFSQPQPPAPQPEPEGNAESPRRRHSFSKRTKKPE